MLSCQFSLGENRVGYWWQTSTATTACVAELDSRGNWGGEW